jgi:hypothetical protein
MRETKNDIIEKFILENRAVGELTKKYLFIKPLLFAVVRNRLNPAARVRGKAEVLEEMEGTKIGKSLAISLATTLTAKHGVDDWIHQFPALKEVETNFIWFRPMLEAISLGLLGEVSWGVKMRVCTGALTSMVDLLTDVYVTYTFYHAKDKKGYFKASFASLLVSLLLQLFVVILQNKNIGLKKVIKESIPVLIGCKPAIDAYRVSTGGKEEVGHVVDVQMEITILKAIEMLSEAIPGVIIQMMSILNTQETGTGVWISIIVSAFSTGFISATLSYDWDTNPTKRENMPSFYGYIPAEASKRTIVFMALICVSAGNLLIRCFTIVMLSVSNMNYAFTYIGVDLAIFLLIKVLQGDFLYHIPIGGKIEYVVSLLCRCIGKIVNDFTTIVQLRHPGEIGGLHWTCGLFLTFASLPMSVLIYDIKESKDKQLKDKQLNLAWSFAKIVLPMSLFSFFIFFITIDKRYWETFLSRLRSKDMCDIQFKQAETDETKALAVFTASVSQWQHFEEDVKAWVEINWYKWEREKPKWLTEAMKSRIPLEFIPEGGSSSQSTDYTKRGKSPKSKSRFDERIAPLLEMIKFSDKEQLEDDNFPELPPTTTNTDQNVTLHSKIQAFRNGPKITPTPTAMGARTSEFWDTTIGFLDENRVDSSELEQESESWSSSSEA